MLENLNQPALDFYLRGEGGALLQMEAQQELYRRGQESVRMSIDEMIAYLESRGYAVLAPADLEWEQKYGDCPWCGKDGDDI